MTNEDESKNILSLPNTILRQMKITITLDPSMFITLCNGARQIFRESAADKHD